MSFTRRNVGIRSATQRQIAPTTAGGSSGEASPKLQASPALRLPGTRPSPVDGRPTTSTGCLSFDGLLAGHAGFALGSSILLGEAGTTDYASTLLRYFAAEGVVQGHRVHVVGFPEAWGRELPACIGSAHSGDQSDKVSSAVTERMKIAWRYERLGEFGASNVQGTGAESQDVFCHAFDLTKRLTFSSASVISFIPVVSSANNPFDSIQQSLLQALQSSTPDVVHRIIIPSLLSPVIYPQSACLPSHLLPFMHSLRALLRTYSKQLCVMLSMPLTLYPRSTGLTRWTELLCDGVLELLPFPHAFDNDITTSSLSTSGAATATEDRPQGMMRVHRLPVFHERGGGGVGSAGVDDDLAFTVSRRRFVIKPFSLPPVDGDQEAQTGNLEEKEGKTMPKKKDLEF